jgi:hypothetical protein
VKLKELITQYAAFRKSMGEDFVSGESLLNTFCRRLGMEIDVGEIQAEQVELFLAGTGPVNDGGAGKRGHSGSQKRASSVVALWPIAGTAECQS